MISHAERILKKFNETRMDMPLILVRLVYSAKIRNIFNLAKVGLMFVIVVPRRPELPFHYAMVVRNPDIIKSHSLLCKKPRVTAVKTLGALNPPISMDTFASQTSPAVKGSTVRLTNVAARPTASKVTPRQESVNYA